MRLRDRLAGAAERIQRWLQGPDQTTLASESDDRAITLEEAFARLEHEFTPQVRFRIFVTGQPKPLRPEVREQVYLIGREALVNASRHSHATSIEAEVEYLSSRLRVLVRDNGCGMDPQVVRSRPERHWGLLAMNERAASIGAQLRLWSRPGGGTEVEISVPDHMVNHTGGNSPRVGDSSERKVTKLSAALMQTVLQ